MYVVIIGCGRVGSQLARVLTLEGHEAAIIDKNPAAFERLGPIFKGKTIAGVGFDLDILKASGIEQADAFIAVTNGDNSNILGARIAKDRFHVPKVVARIYDPKSDLLYQRMGITTISSTRWAANKIKNLLAHAEIVRHLSFGGGEVELVEAEISPVLAGRRVVDLGVAAELNVVAIVRLGRAFIPSLGTELEAGDHIQAVVLTSSVPKFKRMLGLV